MISIKNLSFKYDYEDENAIQILKDINLEIKEGEFVALLGHNGSGKSTLAKLINGLLLPGQGDVLVDEEYGDVFIPGQLLIGEAGDILQQGDGVAVLGGLNSLGQRVILLAVDLRGLIRLTDGLGKGRGDHRQHHSKGQNGGQYSVFHVRCFLLIGT